MNEIKRRCKKHIDLYPILRELKERVSLSMVNHQSQIEDRDRIMLKFLVESDAEEEMEDKLLEEIRREIFRQWD